MDEECEELYVEHQTAQEIGILAMSLVYVHSVSQQGALGIS